MEQLSMIENELVPVYTTSTGEKVVYGTDLHEVLEVKTRYNDWSERRLADIDAMENEDYEVLLKNERLPTGGRPTKDHIIKLDAAKEMAMLERNEKGKQVRRYFIQVEKRYKGRIPAGVPTGKQLMALAVLEAQKTIEEQNRAIERMAPKEVFADAVASSHSSILIGELAKILRQNGIDTGEKRLFHWMRQEGFLIRRKGTDYNMPTQRSMELRLFEVRERTINNPDGSVRITKTTVVTGKGQQYFINKFLQGQSGE
ncbi:MAG: phage antirepressor KilAC domain-containing protein [Acetatifactor muris]|nr:phage antirepressor KilAC domain-containing protein [Acetatifactor muris]